MAFYVVVSVAALACIAMVKGTFVNGRFDRSYSDNGFDDSGNFLGGGGIFDDGDDDMLMHEVGSYVGGGTFNRGIGHSLSGGILGGGVMNPGFGMSLKHTGIHRFGGGMGGPRIGGGIGAQRIGGGIGGQLHGIGGGILGGGRGHFGKFRRGRVSAGLAGFARRPHRAIGMGGILGARRRSWKMY